MLPQVTIEERLLFYKSHFGQTPKNKSRMLIIKQFGRPSFYKKIVEKKEEFKKIRSLSNLQVKKHGPLKSKLQARHLIKT